MKPKDLFPVAATALAFVLLAGCSTSFGTYGPSTHFTYPNSNVEPLGPVSAERTKWSVVFPRNFSKDDVFALYDDALSQQAGADTTINYDVRTTVTMFGPVVMTKMELHGTAAAMTVGRQRFLETQTIR